MQNFFIDDTQRKTIEDSYNDDRVVRMIFGDTSPSQDRAQGFLQEHKLDLVLLEQLESRWSVSWSNKWGSGMRRKKRVLYQW
jgi:hypothetical protein